MNKTVLITGASSGIGMETAYEYASKGYDLIIVARRKVKLDEIKKSINEKYSCTVTVIPKDLSGMNSAEELYNDVKNMGLKTDILINNAGFGIKGQFIESEIKRDEEMMMLNMLTLTKLTKLFSADMVKNGGGTIINISSTAAFQAVPNLGIYSASKAFVLSFSEAIAFELKKHNIRVIAICPGATESEFAQVAGFGNTFTKQSIPTSKDLAGFIYKSMGKNCPVAIHGLKNKFMVWSARFVPRQLVVKIAGMMIKNS